MNPGDEFRAQVEQELRDILIEGGTPLDDLERMYLYHMGFCDQNGKPVDLPRGKYLRPVLCLTMCAALGGDPAQAIPAAASLEIGHRCTLIFDDIQDKGVERNNRPTVWSIWGADQAINAGLALSSFARIALHRLKQRGIPDDTVLRTWTVLEKANLELCRGQSMDISFMDGRSVGVPEYMDMIRGKTGTLFGAACEVAAIIASCDDRTVELARDFGLNMGIAFQIHDDYLGIWGDETKVGKTANDLMEKKRTLPVMLAMKMAQRNPEVEGCTVQPGLNCASVQPEDAIAIKAFMEGIGVPEKVREMEDEYSQVAARLPEQLDLRFESTQFLMSLLDRVTDRRL